MINFRYHVVSLTAVFLALAIGLVVGTAALNGPVADTLKDRVDALSRDNSNYRDQANQYRDELNRAQDFATEVAPALLNGKLADRRILVLVLPGAEDHVDAVTKILAVAGAKINATVTVQDKFFDAAYQYELLDLADQSSRPTIPAEGLPNNSDGVETSSALLGRALLQGTSPVDTQDLTSVLTAYSEPGYISVSENPVAGAEATVIISGLPPVDRDAAKKSQAALTMASQLSKAKPLVVAGNGIGDGNLVSAVRADPTLVGEISTVDNVSTEQGQLATAMTVIERVVQDRVGQYGLSAGATSLVPKAAS